MSRSVKVLWAENAIQDLQAIKDFISQDSPKRAITWLQELFDKGENLSHFPNRGRVVPEFNQENIRELLIENYRLVYRFKPASVEILTVFEGHRQIRKKDIEG